MPSVLSDYYRLPDHWGPGDSVHSPIGDTGFFHFGSKIVCYGSSKSGIASDSASAQSFDALKSVRRPGAEIYLPCDISGVIDNLRREHYVKQLRLEPARIGNYPSVRKVYYFSRNFLPDLLRRSLQRSYFTGW